jgi:Protein of unknown function (DUF3551)
LFAFAVVAASLGLMRSSHAYQTGDAKWSTVTNKGADSMQWECEYDTSDECAAAVAGTGGYCAVNPFWRPDKRLMGAEWLAPLPAALVRRLFAQHATMKLFPHFAALAGASR